MSDPTPAEIEAGVAAVRELEEATTERYLTTSEEVVAVLRAVLPDRDARVRADERAKVAEAIAEAIDGVVHDAGFYFSKIARQHATAPEGGTDG